MELRERACAKPICSSLWKTTEEAIRAAELFFQYYRENANYLERTYDFVVRFGIEKVREETVYAPQTAQSGIA